MANQRNVTLISLRRLGKTALIRQFFASQRRFAPAFVDLYRTTDQQDMVLRIAQETLRQVGKPTGAWLKEVASAIRSLEFNLQFDAVTGLPELGVSLRPGQMQVLALDELFKYLERHKKPVVLALDEFQQVMEYPEKNTEAVLREQVQKLRNVQFIFSGSDRRMMQAIFTAHGDRQGGRREDAHGHGVRIKAPAKCAQHGKAGLGRAAGEGAYSPNGRPLRCDGCVPGALACRRIG